MLLALYCTGYRQDEWFDAQLEDLIHSMQAGNLDATYCQGIAGVSWFIEYLNQHAAVYQADLLSDIDLYLTNWLQADHAEQEIELLQGYAGIACYFALRARNTDQSTFFQLYLDKMQSLASETTNTMCWQQPDYSVFLAGGQPGPEYNLGFAHGNPGIIASCLAALRFDSTRQQASAILRKSCNWLRQQARPTFSRYGYLAQDQEATRISWCYGDLSIAVSGLLIARSIDEPELFAFFLQLARDTVCHAADYPPMTDLTLCHGHSGMYVLYRKLADITGEALFATAASQQLSLMEQQLEPCVCDYQDSQRFGLLDGLAGIILALHASQPTLSWLAFLLVNDDVC